MTLPMAIRAASSPHLLALLADRDPHTRTMYAEQLKLDAWGVDETDDGAEALALAIAHHPSVVVTATRLPTISGYQLAGLLRRDPVTQNIPIVMVASDEAEIARAERFADSVLVKPCLSAELMVTLQRLVSSSGELRVRSVHLRERVASEIVRSDKLIDRSRATTRRYTLSRALDRHDTTTPAIAPPSLTCPQCEKPLTYRRSHVGGVSEKHREQWDYFECEAGCGTFQYRERTRKLRKV